MPHEARHTAPPLLRSSAQHFSPFAQFEALVHARGTPEHAPFAEQETNGSLPPGRVVETSTQQSSAPTLQLVEPHAMPLDAIPLLPGVLPAGPLLPPEPPAPPNSSIAVFPPQPRMTAIESAATTWRPVIPPA